MKNFVSIFFLMLFFSCGNPPKGDEAQITTEQEAVAPATGHVFNVDTSASWIRFNGFGVGKNHPGRFKISSGSVTVNNNQVTGGIFTVDVKSLDMEEEGKAIDEKLKPHLLSGDFFDAEKFGTATFVITGVSPYNPSDGDTSVVEGANFNVSGNLTIKGVTKNVTFPAYINLDKDEMHTKANFDIDRTQWQINYGSDKTLGDKFISEKVNIQLEARAVK